MPPIVDASRAYVTMGEMCDALRERLGRLARDAGLLTGFGLTPIRRNARLPSGR